MADLHPEVLKMIEAGPLAVEVDHDTGKVKKREHPQDFARRCVQRAVELERGFGKETADLLKNVLAEVVAQTNFPQSALEAMLKTATDSAIRRRGKP